MVFMVSDVSGIEIIMPMPPNSPPPIRIENNRSGRFSPKRFPIKIGDRIKLSKACRKVNNPKSFKIEKVLMPLVAMVMVATKIKAINGPAIGMMFKSPVIVPNVVE